MGRLATVNEKGEPHVVPTSFRYNPDFDAIDTGGHNVAKSKKFRDAAKTGRAAFVVDDVLPGGAWQARDRGGRAEVLEEGGQGVNAEFDAEMIRVVPQRIVGWGIDSDAFRPNSRSVG